MGGVRGVLDQREFEHHLERVELWVIGVTEEPHDSSVHNAPAYGDKSRKVVHK